MRNEPAVKKGANYLIIIPAYNEEKTIREVVLGAKAYADVCVVDDYSQDRTPEILSSIKDIHIIRHETNTHIPGAIIDGMRYAVRCGYDYCITMDAGLSHNPQEIPNFTNQPHADLTIGVRQVKINTPVHRKFLSRVANFVYNCSLDFPATLFRYNRYQDLTSGYRRYSNAAMNLITSSKIESKSFAILFETAMIVYRNGLTLSEVPVTYNFTNSSLNHSAVMDCIRICLNSIIRDQPDQ